MALTLISLLGRTPRDTKGGYRTTRHSFPDGYQEQPSAFFGWSLRNWLRPKPERMVILGTAGSMWDYLFETADHEGALEEPRLELQEPTERKQVTQALLDRWAPLLQQRLGFQLRLLIIPYGRDEAEPLRIVEAIAEQVAEGDRVHLDVTHGFRHLPMLALVAALYLRKVRRADIQAIWYAAFDPDTGEAPVYDLKGLLHMADWVGALQSFDKDGDYGVFAALLQGRWATAELASLREAAYLERVSRITEAQGRLRGVDAALSREPAGGVAGLFTPRLRERIAWIHGQSLYQRQRALAVRNLEQADYLRATVFAYESFVTRQVQQQGGDPTDHARRDAVRRELEKHMTDFKHKGPQVADYRLLQGLRNHFAHGTRAGRGEVEQVAASADRVRSELARLISSLLPDQR